jgi:hypothetical protein
VARGEALCQLAESEGDEPLEDAEEDKVPALPALANPLQSQFWHLTRQLAGEHDAVWRCAPWAVMLPRFFGIAAHEERS